MRAGVAVVISGLVIIAATGCTSGSSNESSAGNHGGAVGQGRAAPAVAAPSTPRTAPRGAPIPPDQSIVRTADITVLVRTSPGKPTGGLPRSHRSRLTGQSGWSRTYNAGGRR